MLDYKSIFIKWLALFEIKSEERIALIKCFHDEIKKGFDVITKISIQEIEAQINDKSIISKINSTLEQLLAFSVYGGYLLYLVKSNINPYDKSLLKNSSTEKVGIEWMAQYTKDNFRQQILTIDPIISLFLEKLKEGRINQLLANYPEINTISHLHFSIIDTFINWTSHQGYILGMLETKLSTSNV